MGKSETVWNIAYLIKLNVISFEDIEDFSDELKEAVPLMIDNRQE